jgi:LL-diaminopimelate aminotransferase
MLKINEAPPNAKHKVMKMTAHSAEIASGPRQILASRLDGIGEYYFSGKLREIEELNRQGRQILNLGIGSPDLPPHPEVIRVLQEESARPAVHGYQNYKGVPILRKAMASWYHRSYGVDLDPDTEILPLMGSKEGIMHICMTYLNPGDGALVPNPGYPTYRSAVRLAGGRCIEYSLKKENEWFPDFMELESLLPETQRRGDLRPGSGAIKILWVNYPQMPTGKLPTPALFEQLVQFARRFGILVCHDNPYSFILNNHPLSMHGVAGSRDCVLELNSLSKSHCMAGWRVGMLTGAADRIGEVLRFKTNMDSGMFLPIQLAAARALGLPNEWYASINLVYKERREWVYKLLGLLDCRFERDQAGLFVWASIPEVYRDAYELSDELLHHTGVFVTPGGIFGEEGNRYLRISLCSNEETLQTSIDRVSEGILNLKLGRHV